MEASLAIVTSLGGTVIDGPADTPYGRMATIAEPTGTQCKLRMDIG
jgi:predicted enzyme related to lactoylglutathione lyase